MTWGMRRGQDEPILQLLFQQSSRVSDFTHFQLNRKRRWSINLCNGECFLVSVHVTSCHGKFRFDPQIDEKARKDVMRTYHTFRTRQESSKGSKCTNNNVILHQLSFFIDFRYGWFSVNRWKGQKVSSNFEMWLHFESRNNNVRFSWKWNTQALSLCATCLSEKEIQEHDDVYIRYCGNNVEKVLWRPVFRSIMIIYNVYAILSIDEFCR